MWLCFRSFTATWTAPRWETTASLHHLWPATSGFSHSTMSKSPLSDWSYWDAISTVSYPTSCRIVFQHVKVPRMTPLICFCVGPGCSLPLVVQLKLPDSSFVASSFYSRLLRSWKPHLARLHQSGSTNAWRPKVSSHSVMHTQKRYSTCSRNISH